MVGVEALRARPVRRRDDAPRASSSATRAAATARQDEQLEHVVEGRRVRAAGAESPAAPSSRSSPKSSERSCDSRAPIQFALPRIVLNSPLCATMRYGCASSQLGNVLVENREWTSASALATCESLQVGEVAPELRRGQHSLVDNGSRRAARDDELRAGGRRSADAPDHVELPLERVLVSARERRRRADEQLSDPRRVQQRGRPGLTAARPARRASRSPPAPRRARRRRGAARAPPAAGRSAAGSRPSTP